MAPETLKDLEQLGIKNPWRDLPGKLVRVTGLLQLHDGAVQIRVTDGKTQFQIVEPNDSSAVEDASPNG